MRLISPLPIIGPVPPKIEVDIFPAMAKPAKRTAVGDMAGKVAEMVASCGR